MSTGAQNVTSMLILHSITTLWSGKQGEIQKWKRVMMPGNWRSKEERQIKICAQWEREIEHDKWKNRTILREKGRVKHMLNVVEGLKIVVKPSG